MNRMPGALLMQSANSKIPRFSSSNYSGRFLHVHAQSVLDFLYPLGCPAVGEGQGQGGGVSGQEGREVCAASQGTASLDA